LENTTNRAEIKRNTRNSWRKLVKYPHLKWKCHFFALTLIKHFGRRKKLLQQGQNLISIVICVSRYFRTLV
jgi:hypothetical protein